MVYILFRFRVGLQESMDKSEFTAEQFGQKKLNLPSAFVPKQNDSSIGVQNWCFLQNKTSDLRSRTIQNCTNLEHCRICKKILRCIPGSHPWPWMSMGKTTRGKWENEQTQYHNINSILWKFAGNIIFCYFGFIVGSCSDHGMFYWCLSKLSIFQISLDCNFHNSMSACLKTP